MTVSIGALVVVSVIAVAATFLRRRRARRQPRDLGALSQGWIVSHRTEDP
jgi:hypothetical protein